jgi:hypothetical protein
VSATTYTITPTSATGIDRAPSSVAVALDASGSVTVTLATVGADPASQTVVFSSEAGPKTVTVTPHLGINGGTVTITGTNGGSLTDPAPATITIAKKPYRQRGMRSPTARMD